MSVVVASRPFLTRLDPRARIKGSRDPLGFQYVWTFYGRKVISNLTTVTNSLRSFTTTLLGFYFADRMVEDAGQEEEQYIESFMRFEQLAAYSRVALKDDFGREEENENEVRGILRVKRNLQEGKSRISILSDYQILSNQRTYGLWGLYKVAAQNSGWLELDRYRLSPKAKSFVESYYLPRLAEDGQSIIPFLERERDFEPKGKDARLAKSLRKILGTPVSEEEAEFYLHHLICGGEGNIMQQGLWEIISELNNSKRFKWADSFARDELIEGIRRASLKNLSTLERRLNEIQSIESVLAPGTHLFNFMLARGASTMDKIAGEVKKEWGRSLHSIQIDAVTEAILEGKEGLIPEDAQRIISLAGHLYEGDYRSAVQTLIDQNRSTMMRRGGSPWVSVHGNRLEANVSDEAAVLPPREAVPLLWINSYFISSLKRVGHQILLGRAA